MAISLTQHVCLLFSIDIYAVRRVSKYYNDVRKGIEATTHDKDLQEYRRFTYYYRHVRAGVTSPPPYVARDLNGPSLESRYQTKLRSGQKHLITDEERAGHAKYFRELKQRNRSTKLRQDEAHRRHYERNRQQCNDRARERYANMTEQQREQYARKNKERADRRKLKRQQQESVNTASHNKQGIKDDRTSNKRTARNRTVDTN